MIPAAQQASAVPQSSTPLKKPDDKIEAVVG
jgi:hypothetical protein